MNRYKLLKNKQQEEINNFPMFFAFNQEQFAEGMEKLGLSPNDTNKIYRGAVGMFYKKEDSKKLKDMLNRHNQEIWDEINKDKTGDGFILDMFEYELANYEYGYTGDISDTLDALGLTPEEINSNKALLDGFKKAEDKFSI